LTDIIADEVKSKHEAGFLSTHLRATKKCNAFIVVVQPDKIQPIIDFSTPKNRFLNDVLKADQIPKHFHETAKICQHRAGFNLTHWRADVQAYKKIYQCNLGNI
jgi:hypothetical protein